MEKNNDKYDKIKSPLDDQAIKRIRRNQEEIELQLESTKIAYDALKKQLELDIPMRQIRRDLRDFEESITRLEGNLKVLQKQIREKAITQLVPKKIKESKETIQETEAIETKE